MIRKAVILADVHLRDSKTTKNFRAVLDFLPDCEPDIFILLGDFMDFASLNPWAENNGNIISEEPLSKEYEFGNKILDDIDQRLPSHCEKHFHIGNHERRIEGYLWQHSNMKGMIELEPNLRLRQRGYTVWEYNRAQNLSKHLCVTHGNTATTMHHARKMAGIYRRTVIYGHRHTSQQWSFVSPIDQRDYYYARAIGTLGDMNPWYLRNKESQWQSSFSMVYLDDRGRFNEYEIHACEGRFIWNGKEYKG